MEYSIMLFVKNYKPVNIICETKEEYERISELCQNLFPDKQWKETKIKSSELINKDAQVIINDLRLRGMLK